jgi:hypothetical protein
MVLRPWESVSAADRSIGGGRWTGQRLGKAVLRTLAGQSAAYGTYGW